MVGSVRRHCEDAIDGRVGLCGVSSGWVARRVSWAERTVSTKAWGWVQGTDMVMAGVWAGVRVDQAQLVNHGDSFNFSFECCGSHGRAWGRGVT